ncbi:nucleoside diphosphate kinase [Bombardia bombarda]|uniref:Nucleoside diphosphate kinase n=1 Tax=Bombardia bombarda TaxID=252184 RepID=A0AA39WIA8_9PEZI|nr:nucleoside diphosphate kinase [Bombardia bombarda]
MSDSKGQAAFRPENTNPAFDVWKLPRKPKQNVDQPYTRPRAWSPHFLFLGICGILVVALFFGLHSAAPTAIPQNFSSPPPFVTSLSQTSIVPLQTPSTTSSPSDPVKETNISKMATEQTFIAIKPDGVQRGLIAPIIARFEQRGYKLAAIKMTTPGKAHLEKHYEDLKDKKFFPGLVEYMNSGPICAMVWEGLDAVKTGRVILGATNPLASDPGSIRGAYALSVGRNVCHGSDSVENAKKEIALWFKEGEVISWKSASDPWVYE